MSTVKNILLSNDDGIESRGIWALKEHFDDYYNVFVVAPDRERSATGHSISLHDPIRLKVVEKGRVFAVNGTPVDAVQQNARLCWRSIATPQRRTPPGWHNANSTAALQGFLPRAKAIKTHPCGD